MNRVIQRFLNRILITVVLFACCIRVQAQHFVRVEETAGLGHTTSANGIGLADYDRDGDLDIFLVGFKSFDLANGSTWNRLLKNNGNGTFEDVTLQAGFTVQFTNTGVPAARGEKMGAAWGDYDNDSFPDLFLTNSRGDELYHNERNGTFINVTRDAGLTVCNDCYSSSGLWWDFDRDGDLDLYVSRINAYNVLYENEGDGTFIDKTETSNLKGGNITWTSVPLDVDGDGWLDLYLVNDTHRNQLFVNNRDKSFREETGLYGLDDPGAGMGVTIGDYNNDGLFDVYVTNIYNHRPNPLFTALTAGDYRNDAKRLGVDNTGWGWGTQFFDADNDGDEDLYSVNGIEENQYVFNEVQVDTRNVFFKNMLIENGGEGFIDWSVQSATNLLTRGRGLETFDYDSDGDIDLLVANNFEKPALFKNESINGEQLVDRNWIEISLQGTQSNRDAIGTKIKVTANGKSYYRWYHGAAFLGQSLKPVHVGLGSATGIEEIQVWWPNGLVEKMNNVNINQHILLKEGDMIKVETPPDTTHITPSSPLTVSSYPNPFYGRTTI
ncbi:MAG: CRTAC1 family protein, partial [Chitinophagaceae bacterium]|nr:CRTAC1 family protein [Chitinophagaceae bacterium]